MPLSEHEQRQLEQIEQALYAEHPRCYWAAMSYRRMNGLATGKIQLKERRAGRKDKLGGKRSAGGLGERLEERWRRRQQGRDR